MLNSRIRPIPITDPEPEDLFLSFLPHLFPDDLVNHHGDPGGRLVYASPRFGEIELRVPEYASGEQGRKLFAHYLWNAGVVVSAFIEEDCSLEGEGDVSKSRSGLWRVKGKTVLELGAGTALPSIVSALAGASSVTVTDHPSSPALFSGAISTNVSKNIPSTLSCTTSIDPHEWGVLSSPFAQSNKGKFTRIIAADCLWMREQHRNLITSMLHFLVPPTDDNEEGGSGGRVWVVAGFHTGREIVADFFDIAEEIGLGVENIFEIEGKIGERRDWVRVREGEGVAERKKWCVVAVMKRIPGSM